MSIVTSSIEINSSPEHVRKVLLDFESIPSWTQGFIRSIKPANSQKKNIEKGDKLNVKLEGASFSPVVLENSPEVFKWRGSIPLLFNGDHSFRFEPGKTPGTTTFHQSEEFTGIMTVLLKVMPQTSKQKEGFDGFNSDFKKRVESLK